MAINFHHLQKPYQGLLQRHSRVPVQPQHRLLHSPENALIWWKSETPNDYWAQRVQSNALEKLVQGDDCVPMSAADIACRTVELNEECWEIFRDTPQKRVMRTWDDEAADRFDPEGLRHRWGPYYVYVEGVNGLDDLALLRRRFTKTIDAWLKMKTLRRWEPCLNNVFFINEEVMDLVLEGLARRETSFIHAVFENFKPGDEDDPHEGPFKAAVKELGIF